MSRSTKAPQQLEIFSGKYAQWKHRNSRHNKHTCLFLCCVLGGGKSPITPTTPTRLSCWWSQCDQQVALKIFMPPCQKWKTPKHKTRIPLSQGPWPQAWSCNSLQKEIGTRSLSSTKLVGQIPKSHCRCCGQLGEMGEETSWAEIIWQVLRWHHHYCKRESRADQTYCHSYSRGAAAKAIGYQ